ncbi:MAG: hypothetical protein C5B50_01320 [Verrucomicrobia bacterium]|nr:MAG: hypothetical protein C5B50_01320 [Verrucomicrobiota bacterium]
MQVRLLLGPAGSGKTYKCLAEIREALKASAEGAPLLLVAPKQMTYQLERQLLDDPALPGYTRLHILSFERLATFIFQWLGKPAPRMLDEEGRLMVLRSLLARNRDKLKLFRASARLTGFAQQLSLALSEIQANQLTPEMLEALATQIQGNDSLSRKLQDLATLLQDYLVWLDAHDLRDADCLLGEAVEAVAQSPKSEIRNPKSEVHSPKSKAEGRGSRVEGRGIGGQGRLRFAGVWVDGFAELSGQELDLLAGLIPHCDKATVTFCLDSRPSPKISWLSNWSVPAKTFEQCEKRFEQRPGAVVSVQVMERDGANTRFEKNPVLSHLERAWCRPAPYPRDEPPALRSGAPRGRGARVEVRARPEDFKAIVGDDGRSTLTPLRDSEGLLTSSPTEARQSRRDRTDEALRIAMCANPGTEAILAAHEILRHVRAGGRYREITVLARSLAAYHEPLQRVFARYDIPFFLDRRESVAHHPLAELTRSSLRAVTLGWQHEDWFAALKTGLAPVSDEEIDRLENEALARGWKGSIWKDPVSVADDPELTTWLGKLHRRLLPPFQRLGVVLGTPQDRRDGPALAAALREFWQALNVQATLEDWSRAHTPDTQSRLPQSVHATVWTQMNGWLENVELAFEGERLQMREWQPILEAGLANLTVGVIPPALDQVLIGAIDRSRNPDIRLALILGVNETVFPAPVDANLLLTEPDRLELEKRSVLSGKTSRYHLGRERHYAYLACTRARQRLVLTCSQQDLNGSTLNPSPFLTHVQELFPSLQVENFIATNDWRECEHVSDLIAPLLKVQGPKSKVQSHDGSEEGRGSRLEEAWAARRISEFPGMASLLQQTSQFQYLPADDCLSPELAPRLYGQVLQSSVSRLEQFAACPFRFFVHSGLRAEERKKFELDSRERGTFQHDALALFHERLREEHTRWRDLTPEEARKRIGQACDILAAQSPDGLLQATDQSRFTTRMMTSALQDFVEILVTWMREQYLFDPVRVELPFGVQSRGRLPRQSEAEAGEGAPADDLPAWTIELGSSACSPCLELSGRIDRVDFYREPSTGDTFCVVVDYKSSPKRLEPVLMANGLQLQLLAYLSVLRRCSNPLEFFGAASLLPAGVFYVNLRGQFGREQNRRKALTGTTDARKKAYQHTGRFDVAVLRLLDARADATQGDQFKYRLTKEGEPYKNSVEALQGPEFEALLDSVEANLKRIGLDIFAGEIKVAPYRKGSTTACDQCDYQSICRIDPWTHTYRSLKAPE